MSLAAAGVIEAVQRHDTATIFDWLIEALSYQGVSDAVAGAFIDAHGCVRAAHIQKALGRRPSCPKLKSYWHFEGCGYRKGNFTCNELEHLDACPLPRHLLRNGSLNQAAYSLYLFLRDVAGGDLVAWIDAQLEAMSSRGKATAKAYGDAVLGPLTAAHGVSWKILSMAVASLLLAGDVDRPLWMKAGASMIAVDTLVHNWLHRTGILQRWRFQHAYGPQCYSPLGCATLIRIVSRYIDARTFNPAFPKTFPRFVQKAIWNFCAQDEFNQCNGNRIDDRKRCDLKECELYSRCGRIALNPTPKA